VKFYLRTIYVVIMHLFFFLIAVCAAIQTANADQSSIIWNLFKRVHEKQYLNVREEQYR
jgi:hypothetical protein